jgi:hypothetical protein
MVSITQKDAIRRPWLKLIKPTLLEDKTPTTKSPEMTCSRCSPMHELIACLVQESWKKYLVPNMTSGIHRLSPISPQSPMLVEHRPSHLTKGTVFSLYHTILTSHIGRGKLMFETQIMAKGFELRVFKFGAIVTTNSSNIISIPLILQPQDLRQNQMSPSCQPKRSPKHSENSHPLSPGRTISHPPSTPKMDQPSPYGTDHMASLS